MKNRSFWIVMLVKTLESPLDCKEIKPVHPKGNQPWKFIGRTDGWSWSSNTLATWCEEPTHWKRTWCWERLKAGGEGDDKGWDGWMASPTNGRESEQTLGDGEKQESLECCSPWVAKNQTWQQLNNNRSYCWRRGRQSPEKEHLVGVKHI